MDRVVEAMSADLDGFHGKNCEDFPLELHHLAEIGIFHGGI